MRPSAGLDIDHLRVIDAKEAYARTILSPNYFSDRKLSEFEQFLQLFSAAFEAKRTSEKDAIALTKFLDQISTAKNTHSERVDLFLLAAAFLKQHKTRKPALENSLKKKIGDNNGCLEFDPLSILYAGKSITTTSTTLVGFDPGHHSSYYLPSQIDGEKSKELFQERMRLLYTDIAKLSHDISALNENDFIQENFEDFIFELYENIIDHAKDEELNQPKTSSFPKSATFWFIRFERIAVPPSGVIPTLPKLGIYQQYAKELTLRRKKPPQLLVSLSIYDNGPGIFGHYDKRHTDNGEVRDFFGFERILLERRTSKSFSGAGWGIRRAMDSIAQLDGLVIVRSNEFWAAKLPQEANFRNIGRELKVRGETLGTLYTVILPVWS